jgi:tRNA(Ile2) C34 agmatinyltransferase TiaS
MACEARRISDGSFRCTACGTAWDADDEKPECKPQKVKRDATSKKDRKEPYRRRHVFGSHLPRT